MKAGISRGDSVEIETRDGRHVKMTVAEVTATALEGRDEHVELADIRKLYKRSWSLPRNPCDTGPPLDCSIPGVVTVFSDFHDEYGQRFLPACVAHDLCYRHGYLTYGHARTDCDSRFLDDMQRQCRGLLDLDPWQRAECEVAARHLYDMVARHGTPAFRGAAGSYCEYAGPP